MGHQIYLIDDDTDVREALALLLRTSGMAVTAFADASSFLIKQPTVRPGCVITDIRMPAVSGLQMQEALVRRSCDWPIIVITGHGDINACRRAFKAGAVEFLTKPIDEHDLLSAIDKAMADLDRQSRQSAEISEARALVNRLTPREREVFDMVASGLQSKDIALALDVSPRTIEVHRAHFAAKLGTTSVADFARLALLAGGTRAERFD
jgi:FixJ family two-component response regulator